MKIRTLLVLALAWTLTGCAYCREHEAVCAVPIAVAAASVAASMNHNDQQPGRRPVVH